MIITLLSDDQWLREEWQRVSHYHRKNLKTIILTFSRLAKAASYQDYLMNMTQSLEALGLVDDHFEKRILDREKEQSTIFGNGIAFPHTINQTLEKIVLMVGVLEEPYHTDHESVDLIFLVAIPNKIATQTEAELLELYDDIFRIASDKELKEALERVENKADFITFTREKGVF